MYDIANDSAGLCSFYKLESWNIFVKCLKTDIFGNNILVDFTLWYLMWHFRTGLLKEISKAVFECIKDF